MKFLKNPNNMICIIAVLAISLLCQSAQVCNPGMEYFIQDTMMKDPTADASGLMMVAALPSLAMVFCTLLYPILRRYVSVRLILIVSGVLLVGFGVAPLYTEDVSTIMVERFIFGIGCGFTWPAVQSTICASVITPSMRRPTVREKL